MNKSGRKWKEATVAYLKLLSHKLSGETKENHKIPQNSRSSIRDSNPETP